MKKLTAVLLIAAFAAAIYALIRKLEIMSLPDDTDEENGV